MLGARRKGTGMYSNGHEDFEHRATTRTGAAIVFQQTSRHALLRSNIHEALSRT